jgi:hypothetical protein
LQAFRKGVNSKKTIPKPFTKTFLLISLTYLQTLPFHFKILRTWKMGYSEIIPIKGWGLDGRGRGEGKRRGEMGGKIRHWFLADGFLLNGNHEKGSQE